MNLLDSLDWTEQSMPTVHFVDTSILCNLVPVPGRDQQRAEVVAEQKQLLASGDSFILPVTAVIETGNFIAQIADGGLRRQTASNLEGILQLILDNKAPWQLHVFNWDRTFLEAFLAGASSGQTYVEHAANKVGAGDLCILTERAIYRARTRLTNVNVWSKDEGLMAHN